MKFSLKAHVARLSAGAMLAATLAGAAFGLQSTASFAQGCSPTTVITVPNSPVPSSGACDMTVNATINPGTLSFTNTGSVSVSATYSNSAQIIPFSFTNTVTDARGTMDGWELEASSAGLAPAVAGPANLDVSLDSTASSCAAGTCPNPLVVTPTGHLIATSPADFLQAPGGVVETGTYTNNINGTVYIPAGQASGGYSGTIILTLFNAAD